MKLMRPTKQMMLAINAQLEGDARQADGLVREHGLDRKEMQLRIEKRAGEKYTFSNKRRGKRGKNSKKVGLVAAASAPTRDILALIDGRTKIATLVRLESRIDEILALRNGRDVSKIRDAMKQINDLRKRLQVAESVLAAS